MSFQALERSELSIVVLSSLRSAFGPLAAGAGADCKKDEKSDAEEEKESLEIVLGCGGIKLK